MEIIYGDKNLIGNEQKIEAIAKSCDITVESASLLFCRGFDTALKVKDFLNTGKHGFIDPYKLSGMREAVNLISDAKNTGKNVLIFGDYDADGICAVSVLKNCLEDFGITPDFIVPEREEGYGLNLDIITRLNAQKKIDLLISVDCGVSDKDVIEEIKKLGITVIVTDHHEPPSSLPDTIVINPKIAGQQYSFTGLAGAGVAYKLGYALIGDEANKYLDIVSLATVADSMDLVGENRHIVAEGLKIYNSPNLYPPLKCLMGEVNKQITAGTLAYTLSPKINAGGRMGDAKCALKLMTSKDATEIENLAVKLTAYNMERQSLCDSVYREAKEKIKQNKLSDNAVILVRDDNWQAGFVGIVASKLAEEYMRPVIVFAKYGDNYKGSCRSTDEVNIFEAITDSSDLLVAFGGHSQAAGVTVSDENYLLFQERLNAFVKDKYGDLKPTKKLFVDMKINDKFSIDFAREIELMEPFGIGNKRPLFAIEERAVTPIPLKAGSGHFSIMTDKIELLDFNGATHVETLSVPVPKTIIFESNLSKFKGREYLKGYLRYIISEFDAGEEVGLYLFQNVIKSLANDDYSGEVQSFDEDHLSPGYGTLYVIGDIQNLNAYDMGGLAIEYFNSQSGGVTNKILVAPSTIPDGYGKIVYLDEPIKFLPTTEKTYCNYSYCGYEQLEYVETDREVFAEVYKLLCQMVGSDFSSSIKAYLRYAPMDNPYQFIFSTEVFLELGLFKIEMGKLIKIDGVKNPLTNSKIYRTVFEIRG